MAQGNDKSDLSNLKARLGLDKSKSKAGGEDDTSKEGAPASEAAPADKPAAADGPGPAGKPPGAGPPGAGGPPGAPGPSKAQEPSSPSQAAPAPTEKPAGQSQPGGPSEPPKSTAAGRQSAQPSFQSTRSERTSAPAFDDIELDDGDFDAVGDEIFSKAIIGLMAFVLLGGMVFGWVASNTINDRKVYTKRTEDADHIRSQLQPHVEELEKARQIIGDISGDEVDYEAAEQLAELDLVPGDDLFASNRVLLGSKLVGYTTSYLSDVALLSDLFEEHNRLTNEIDKEELEALIEDNEVVQEDNFAVLFDYDHLAQTSGSEDYIPRSGQLVTTPDAEQLEEELDDSGEIEVQLLNSERTVKTPIQGLLPLPKGQILESGGRNALKRYRDRIAQIERQIDDIEKYREDMMDQLTTLAEQDSPPLISL